MSNINKEIKSEDDIVELEPNGGGGVWNEAIESYFIELIEDEVKKKNRPTTTLTKPAWRSMKQKLKEKTKKDYSQDQMKNKYNQLRAKWKDFSKILEETGIGFNSVTFQLSTEDSVWKKLYEKHKSAKTFKKKGCKHYDKLCLVFGDTTATGASSHPSTKSPSDSEDVSILEQEGEKGPKAKKAKLNVYPKKLREKVNNALADALIAMSENSEKKLELLEKKMNATTSNTSINDGDDIGNHPKGDNALLMECIDALSSLEGVDGSSFAKATKLIHDDSSWRMIFLRLPNNRKKDFVLYI